MLKYVVYSFLLRVPNNIISILINKFRVLKYLVLSDNKPDIKGWTVLQPCVFSGDGEIISRDVTFGFRSSPGFFSSYTYIEARENDSKIIIGNNSRINNGATIIAEKGSIEIGRNFLAGVNLTIINSNFHDTDPALRLVSSGGAKDVSIADNVFCGNNVTILKGVKVGVNSVIASGSVVTKDVPDNVIYAGNPAKQIRKIK